MGRTSVKDKLRNVEVRPGWQRRLLDLTRSSAEDMVSKGRLSESEALRLPEIMNDLLGEGKIMANPNHPQLKIMGIPDAPREVKIITPRDEARKEESDLAYRHILLEYENNETTAFTVLIGCAFQICKHEQVFPYSPAQAKSAIETGKPEEVIEWYRPLFDEAPDFIVWDLNRYASPAGQRGRTRDTSNPKRSFIVTMTRILRNQDGTLKEKLFERLYRFTFGEKIHLPDYRDDINRAEAGLAARLPGGNTPTPEG